MTVSLNDSTLLFSVIIGLHGIQIKIRHVMVLLNPTLFNRPSSTTRARTKLIFFSERPLRQYFSSMNQFNVFFWWRDYFDRKHHIFLFKYFYKIPIFMEKFNSLNTMLYCVLFRKFTTSFLIYLGFLKICNLDGIYLYTGRVQITNEISFNMNVLFFIYI